MYIALTVPCVAHVFSLVQTKNIRLLSVPKKRYIINACIETILNPNYSVCGEDGGEDEERWGGVKDKI